MNRKALSADKIECERIALGEPDDYKPCIALLPSGELLLTAFHPYEKEKGKVFEQNLLFRSKDGGKTWSKPEKLDLLGREPYLTVLKDGTLFMTGHLLAQDIRNKLGYHTRAEIARWPARSMTPSIATGSGRSGKGSSTCRGRAVPC